MVHFVHWYIGMQTPFANIADFVSLNTVLSDNLNSCRIIGSDTPFNEETGELVGFSEVGEYVCPSEAAEFYAENVYANVTDTEILEGDTQESDSEIEGIEATMGEWTSMANEVEMTLAAEYATRNAQWHKLGRDVGQQPHGQYEFLAQWRRNRFFSLIRYIDRSTCPMQLIRIKDKCWAKYKQSLASCIVSKDWSGQYLTKYDILELTRLIMARVKHHSKHGSLALGPLAVG